MSLTDEERDAVVYYRIQKAKDTLNEAIGQQKQGIVCDKFSFK